MCARVHAPRRDAQPRMPRVGVGCLVVRDGLVLLVRNHEGFWSTPGGHLEFCELPEKCAARETEEETRLRVSRIEFVAISSDILPDPPRHYITIWMRGEAGPGEAGIGDSKEVAELGWFDPGELPTPLLPDFRNLVEGRRWPVDPPNLPALAADRPRSAPDADGDHGA
ncbi:MAG TPA: NUDIX hydrolase [Candidatus Polarisedimenticolia bacterium]|jgi:8-oxo-dGTP diphosphatase|nr:NUDIX hydrolase [Candidatus Polarisedimenticolia bacterium]